MRLCDEPRLSIERAADEQHVGRRQLERDFERWIGVAPRAFIASQRTPIAAAFRAATGGGTVYL
jgi:transcriptional regulator GlxA family with amidase domain